MESESHGKQLIQRLYELLVGLLIVVGLGLILVSFLLPLGGSRDMTRGIGISLFPAGVVAFLLTRFAASTTEMLLRKTVETTIQDRLQEDMRVIEATVSRGLSQIGDDMKEFSPLFISATRFGLQNVYLTRAEALEDFARFLDAETQKADRGESARVWIVSTSIRGFLVAASKLFDGRRMLERIVQSNCELRILMTDPEYADFRTKQEERAEGEIPTNIRMNLAYLKRIGIKRESIRYYPGAPTVFAIATTDRMLLNPYPYQIEAFRCLSLIVYKTLEPRVDIFHQYARYHFKGPWECAVEVSLDEWDKLE